MKHLILLLTFLQCCLTVFAQKELPLSTISGTCNYAKDGDSVFLASLSRGGLMPIDTAFIKNGKFTLQDRTGATTLRAVLVIENSMPIAATDFVLESGVNLVINFNNSETNPVEIPNSKVNDIWTNLSRFEQSQNSKIEALWPLIADSTKSIDERLKIKQMIDSISVSTYSHYAKAIYDNIPLGISGMLLGLHYQSLSKEDLDKIMDQMKKKSPNDPYYQSLAEKFKVEAETAVGQPFKEIALIDVNGSMKRLSSIVKESKLVLVDFWASWCAPCIAEMPNIRKIYARYHAKGLQIYGVSLDENQLSWQSAIQRYALNWIHVSDLKGWQSKAAQDYSIQSIPSMLLIDSSTGKIIAKNLRGQELENKIAEFFK